MYMLEKTRTQHTFPSQSFSSTLLDKIYRSIEESERDNFQMNRSNGRCNRALEDVAKTNLGRACLIEKWMDNKANDQKVATKGTTHRLSRLHAKFHDHDHDQDQDVVFFSSTSTSTSSDSSSGVFSSSDTDSIYAPTSQSSCFASPRPKSVTTSVSLKSDTSETTQNGVTQQQREHKSRALKIYENLKKSKQPISPGRKLTNFLNSLFTNTKKSKSICSVRRCQDVKDETKSNTPQASTSSSRSCLSKTSPSLRKDRIHRTVRFYPVSVIVDEEDTKVPVMQASRDFFKEHYRQNQNKSDLILRDFPIRINDDDDDDAASDSSSDLFELDHLAFMGNGRYSDELPVYETTHVTTNRAIANALIM